MGNPVVNRTVAVPVGTTGARLDIEGRYVKIVSCTVASVLMGFDQDTPERVYADDCYAGPQNGFRSLHFVDDLGAGSTVVVQVSAEPILGGTLGTLSPVVTALGAINNNTKSPDAPANILVAAVTQTGLGTDTISAAVAAKRVIFLQAPLTNGGAVYIRMASPCTDANCAIVMQPGDTWREELSCAVYASSENGTEALNGYSLAIS